MTYKITYITDSCDCEDCGPSWADGYVIEKDGKVIIDRTPMAHCYNSVEYPHQEAIREVLILEGVEVEEAHEYD